MGRSRPWCVLNLPGRITPPLRVGLDILALHEEGVGLDGGVLADGRAVVHEGADADDETSLKTLAERAEVVLTTVGPYQLYGSPLVAACAAAGTAYVDLCGEPAWMRQMPKGIDGSRRVHWVLPCQAQRCPVMRSSP